MVSFSPRFHTFWEQFCLFTVFFLKSTFRISFLWPYPSIEIRFVYSPWSWCFHGFRAGVLSGKAVEEIGKVESPLPSFLKHARETARSPHRAYTADYLTGISLFDGVCLYYSQCWNTDVWSDRVQQKRFHLVFKNKINSFFSWPVRKHESMAKDFWFKEKKIFFLQVWLCWSDF